MEKDVGYSIIYLSDREKFEISTNRTMLRRTFVQNGIRYEQLYERVTDSLRIGEIEDKSVNWKVFGGQNYFVIRQANADNKYTENIKIVKKENARLHGILNYTVETSPENYIYYVKRKG